MVVWRVSEAEQSEVGRRLAESPDVSHCYARNAIDGFPFSLYSMIHGPDRESCEALARDTHKFESRYLDQLVGPYPERRDLYRERSPIHFTDRLSCPVIFFQGLEDRVVPPNQAEMMVEALGAKGVPVAYLPFEGEGHGFRRAENIKRALDAELYFHSRVFGFELADPVEAVEIENL